MEDLIGISASAAGGGLFGLVGTTLGRIAGYFEKRQSIAHEERRWQHEAQRLEQQHLAAVQTAEARLTQTHVDGQWAGLQASLAAEASISSSYKWVDAIRALTRPGLTLLLWLIATAIWLSSAPAERAMITETATFAATAATLWWFGDRAMVARPKP
ncbi:MAG: hypothetical protein AAGL99_09930 [Pseudomonadota bacterium]